jgi:hypothetical protein
MSSELNVYRDELYKFFDDVIAPMIKTEHHSALLIRAITDKLDERFGIKYQYIVRRYSDTIRVAATLLHQGIVFFMAATKPGCEAARFPLPCYWGKK